MWLWFGKDLVEYIGRKFLWIYSRMCLWGGEGRGVIEKINAFDTH